MSRSSSPGLVGPLHFTDRKKWDALAGQLALPKHVVFEASLDGVETKEHLMRLVAASMAFPDYFGGNWDALDECLRDLSWRPAEGYVLLLHAAEPAWKRNPRALGGLVESWTLAAEEWARAGIAFHLVFIW